MTHSGVDSSLERTVGDFIMGEFPAGAILSVALTDEYESGGERILVFRVEFEGSVSDFVASAPLGISRTVAERLRELDVTGFPFLDFVPTAELHP